MKKFLLNLSGIVIVLFLKDTIKMLTRMSAEYLWERGVMPGFNKLFAIKKSK